MKTFRPRAYPGRAVLVDTGLSPERKLKMQVLYEPNWTAGGWQTPQLTTTNYSDWLRDSSDAGTDSDESLPRYMSVPVSTHHYQVTDSNHNQLPPRPIVIDVVPQESWRKKASPTQLGQERLWAESATEKPKPINDEKKRVQRSQSCRTKGSKFSQLVHRNGGHDPQPPMDPMYENLNARDPWPESHPHRKVDANLGFATIRQPLKQSKSMRSLKDMSWIPEGEAVQQKTKLKHSKSMRSLKNKDRGSRTSSEDSTSSKFSSNTLRRILKFPEMLRSSGNVKNEWDDMKPISNLKTATSLNGFENPAIYANSVESAEYRLSKLLVNSKPFSSASQSRSESVVYEEPQFYTSQQPEDLYANITPHDIETDEVMDDVCEFYKKAEEGPKESRSLLKNLTLRIKRKLNGRSSVKNTALDEYERAGVYGTSKVRDIPPTFLDRTYANVPPVVPPEDSDDFLIPRPKLIVPVHTYGIRKRRTGNTVLPGRTRSDGASSGCEPGGDCKKAHHTSCPGMLKIML